MVVKETSSSAVDSIVTFINFYSLADFWITVIPVACNEVKELEISIQESN